MDEGHLYVGVVGAAGVPRPDVAGTLWGRGPVDASVGLMAHGGEEV
jgi:hypothetical protein